jgi:hypothetical protein
MVDTNVGVYENADEFPEHRRIECENVQVKSIDEACRDKESPKDCSHFKSCEPFYTCPRTPFYRETKRLLHFENTLESKEYS